MIRWIWNLLTDETKFVGLARAVLVGGGSAVAAGQITIDMFGPMAGWLGPLLMAAGAFIRSSTTAEPPQGRLPR